MKFTKFINEILSQWVYKLPEDKRKQLFDFYMLVMLPDSKDENLKTNQFQARDTITKALQQEFKDVLRFAVSAEIRHMFDSNNSEKLKKFFEKKRMKGFLTSYAQHYGLSQTTPYGDFTDRVRTELVDKMKENQEGYVKSLKAVEAGLKKSGSTWTDFMKVAEDAFNELRWKPKYGGEAWASIAKSYAPLINAENYGDRVAQVDHVFDLQHNTDTVFNKLKSYYIGGYSWVLKALEKKKHAKELYDIYDDVSFPVKELSRAVIKDVEDKTLEDWLKSKEINVAKKQKDPEKEAKHTPLDELKVGDYITAISNNGSVKKGMDGIVYGVLEVDGVDDIWVLARWKDFDNGNSLQHYAKTFNVPDSAIATAKEKNVFDKPYFYTVFYKAVKVVKKNHLEDKEKDVKKENAFKVGDRVQLIMDFNLPNGKITKGTKATVIGVPSIGDNFHLLKFDVQDYSLYTWKNILSVDDLANYKSDLEEPSREEKDKRLFQSISALRFEKIDDKEEKKKIQDGEFGIGEEVKLIKDIGLLKEGTSFYIVGMPLEGSPSSEKTWIIVIAKRVNSAYRTWKEITELVDLKHYDYSEPHEEQKPYKLFKILNKKVLTAIF